VSLVTNLGGEITAVICPEHDGDNGICRLKKRASEGGPLVQLLAQAESLPLPIRSTQCDIASLAGMRTSRH
jgi:hypothetical protein